METASNSVRQVPVRLASNVWKPATLSGRISTKSVKRLAGRGLLRPSIRAKRIRKKSQPPFGNVVQAVIAVGALYAILSNKYGADTQKWACGVLGSILTVAHRHIHS